MSEKNLLENLPESIDDMSPEVFAAYSEAVAKGEIEPIKPKEEATPDSTKAPKPGENIQETDEEKAAREKAEADKRAAEGGAAGSKDGNGNLKNKESDQGSPSMPLSKYKHKKENWEKEKAKEIESIKAEHAREIEDLKKSISAPGATEQSITEDIKKFAEENNIKDVDLIDNLVKVITKNLPGIDPETKKLLDEYKKDKEISAQTAHKAAEDLEFERDFLKSATPILKELNPDIDEAHLEEAKQLLKKYAYDDKYLKLDLKEIIDLKKSKFQYNLEKKKSVETSRPGSQTGAVKEYKDWTAEDIDNASPEEFEKYSSAMAASSSSRLKVTDMNGNEVK